VTSQTKLVAANAVYFKGSWSTQFDPKNTQDGPFTLADGTSAQVPTMTRPGTSLLIGSDSDVRALELGYDPLPRSCGRSEGPRVLLEKDPLPASASLAIAGDAGLPA
jgi:hypothetical protein